MARLTPDELRSRLGFDYRATRALQTAACIDHVRAYASLSLARSGRVVTDDEGERGLATFYDVRLDFPVLVGPGETHLGATLRFDVLSGGNYPFTRPHVTVVSRPLPWSPHVLAPTGAVCIGESWDQMRGRMLLAALAVHLVRVFNNDEKDRGAGYVGWNAAAAQYWRKEMGCKPLNPELEYPVLDPAITHATPKRTATFRRCTAMAADPSATPAFRAAPDRTITGDPRRPDLRAAPLVLVTPRAGLSLPQLHMRGLK